MKIIQIRHFQTGAVVTSNNTRALDDNIPTTANLTTDLMTLSIPPSHIANKLKIDIIFTGDVATGAGHSVLALFQDAIANALACSGMDTSDGFIKNIKLTHYMVAGTTSTTTFKVRAGSSNGGTLTMNGEGGNRKYGGVMASSITITEYEG